MWANIPKVTYAAAAIPSLTALTQSERNSTQESEIVVGKELPCLDGHTQSNPIDSEAGRSTETKSQGSPSRLTDQDRVIAEARAVCPDRFSVSFWCEMHCGGRGEDGKCKRVCCFSCEYITLRVTDPMVVGSRR